MASRARATLALLLPLLACAPAPLDETGKRCNEQRPCAEPWVCLEGRCCLDEGSGPPDGGQDAGRDDDGGASDGGRDVDGGTPDGGGTPNLLGNPGFELWMAGRPVGWSNVRGEVRQSSEARTGTASARLVVGEGGRLFGDAGTLVSQPIPVTVMGPTLLCGRVFSRVPPGTTFELDVRERLADGGVRFSPLPNRAGFRDDAGWVAITHALFVDGGQPDASVDFRLNVGGPHDASVLFDDALLVAEPADGGRCTLE
ncbi:MAG: hypothetical protein INH41_21090 [Myxococcaceae bacterium]|nr:hypothetical protein [Myxococcaceae bacterium]MCA3014889.1 hypothetical protein [Myxococcaceae bacterium]